MERWKELDEMVKSLTANLLRQKRELEAFIVQHNIHLLKALSNKIDGITERLEILSGKDDEIEKILSKREALLNLTWSMLGEHVGLEKYVSMEYYLECNDEARHEYTQRVKLYMLGRVVRRLNRAGIITVKDVISKTYDELRSIPLIGNKCMQHIVGLLQEVGLELKK